MAIQIFPPNQLSESSPNGWAHWIQQTTHWMVSDSGHGARPEGCSPLDGLWQETWFQP
jgi:hypothetical protein